MMIPILALMAAAAPIQPTLTPNGPWTVEFADTLCILSRTYEVAGEPVRLLIKAPLVGTHYSIYVARKAGRTKVEARNDAFLVNADGVRFGPFPFDAYTNVQGMRIAHFSPEPEKYQLADSGGKLTVDLADEGKFAFLIPNLPKALQTLEVCIKGLRKDFGIDQTVLDRIVTNEKYVRLPIYTEDYPYAAYSKGLQGNVAVLAFVGVDGRLSGCRVIESSGVPSLDEQTCRLLEERGRYEPARDAQGTKMRSPIYTRVRWRVPS